MELKFSVQSLNFITKLVSNSMHHCIYFKRGEILVESVIKKDCKKRIVNISPDVILRVHIRPLALHSG